MNLPPYWYPVSAPALVNHLWQSTAATGIACLACLELRNNHARVRYWVWFATSLKFLLPFSLLISAGEWVRSLLAAPAVNKPAIAVAVQQIAQPFSISVALNAGAAPVEIRHGAWLPAALMAVWALGVLLVAVRFAIAWIRAYAVVRVARPMQVSADVRVLCSPVPMEPGIFGVFRPVLLLPEGILERLTAGQMRAIVAHEMCHVRRRDNLTFAVHQVVCALFWFHPATWWIGARLLEERERACDEAVVRTRDMAETYAQGILNVCRFYVESQPACIAGVTGADLKQRIVRIMTGQLARKLSPGRKLLLATLCAVFVGVPVVAGLAWAGQQPAPQKEPVDIANLPSFDVVSIKPHKDEGMRMRIGMRFFPDGFSADGARLDDLLHEAFDLPRDRILNEPDWVKSSRFDLQAKVAPDDAPRLKDLSFEQRWSMLIPVFQDRFALKFHHEIKEMEVYTLVVAKGGPKLKEAAPDELGPNNPPSHPDGPAVVGAPRKGQMMMRGSPQGFVLETHASTMTLLARMLSQQIGSTVIDKTGLTGSYDYTLTFTPDQGMGPMMGPKGPPPPVGGEQSQEPPAPSIFTALQEQLGLKLVAQKQKVDVVVIDHMEQPSAN